MIFKIDSFSKYFYNSSLFFHWSYQVRDFFYYFLLFIILNQLKTKGQAYDSDLLETKKNSGSMGMEEYLHTITTERTSSRTDRITNKKEVYSSVIKQLINRFEDNLKIIILIKEETQLVIENSDYDHLSSCNTDFTFTNQKIPKYIGNVNMTTVFK